MQEDNEGFSYPQVKGEICTHCGLCNKVCPVLNKVEDGDYSQIKVFAAKNKDQNIRLKSSSGGIFSLLAEQVIQAGGVVFGAKFNETWEVVHGYTDNIEGLEAFRGSKYVQSSIENSFALAEQFLKEGRMVLFSGTPCQIAGLKLFLRKEYANLLAVDFICHGVPSPKVFRLHRNELIYKTAYTLNDLLFFTFRDKTEGWKKFSLLFKFKAGDTKAEEEIRISNTKDAFLRGFPFNIFLRPSCHSCPSKGLKSGSDITLADFWGIENDYAYFDDDKGVSLVIVNTPNGLEIWDSVDKECFAYPFAKLRSNRNLMQSAPLNPKRKLFFDALDKKETPIAELICRYSKLSIAQRYKIIKVRFIIKIKKVLKALGLLEFIRKAIGKH
jgi:coenzyme F420-reducing hydrogenase beta subunit